MAAISLSGTHTFVGQLQDGQKVVFSDLVADTGTTIGKVDISPLERINSWALGIKHPGTTARTFVTTDGATLSGHNIIWCTPSANPTGAVLCVISIGE